MSSAAALTVIAISVGVLALLALLAVAFLMRLVIHLIALEKTLAHELAEIRQVAAHLRESTERVSQTIYDVQQVVRKVSGTVGTVASILSLALGGRLSDSRRGSKLKPWITGISLGLGVVHRLQQTKSRRSAETGASTQPQRRKNNKKRSRTPATAPSNNSLTR